MTNGVTNRVSHWATYLCFGQRGVGFEVVKIGVWFSTAEAIEPRLKRSGEQQLDLHFGEELALFPCDLTAESIDLSVQHVLPRICCQHACKERPADHHQVELHESCSPSRE